MRKLKIKSLRKYIEGRCEWKGKCLEFQGGKLRGYGVIQIPGTRKTVQTHRALYQDVHGPLERKQVVMHTCDNPSCCNINHLVLGTHKTNSQDAAMKKRKTYNGMKPKLTGEDHKRIKLLAKTLHTDEIAKLYDVHGTTIIRILQGKTKARKPGEVARKAAEARWGKKKPPK